MRVEEMFLFCCGYEDAGDYIRVFFDSPSPKPSISRERGVRGRYYHDFSGDEAGLIRRHLQTYRVLQCLRVPPPYSKRRGVLALRIALEWHAGAASALYEFASTRRVASEEHRDQLRREINLCVGTVLENPVHDHELPQLHLLEDVVNTCPLRVELATPQEVFGGDQK
jgi:hypothetical protein